MSCRSCCLVVVALILSACGRGAGDVIERPGESPVSVVSDDDAEMVAAIRQARDSLDEFERRLANPPATQTEIALKGRFEENGTVEHMWLYDVAVTPEGYQAKIGNEPLDLRNLKLDQRVVVPRDRVSDWLAIDDGRLVAGYTVRLFRSRMSADERGAFDANSGFTVED